MKKILFILVAILMTGCASLVGQASSEVRTRPGKMAGRQHLTLQLRIDDQLLLCL